MGSFRSTLVLFLVLVGLGAYIFFVDSKKPVGDTEKKDKVFTGLASDDIEEMTIKSADGERSRLTKTDGKWTIVEPVAADTDTSEVATISSSLADVEVQRLVDEKPADVKKFGLDPPRVEVSLRAKGQKDAKSLQIGDKTPTGDNLYARASDNPRVFLIASYLESTFNKNTLALRDKRILHFERDKVETVELTSGATTMQFAKSGTEWKILKPIAARGDFGAIEGIVERLASAQMQGIDAQEASDLKKYGLDKPTATMVVGAGSARATLTLGKTDNALVFAKDGSRPMIFTVAPTVKDDVFKKLDDLRRKDVFDARSFNATRVELKRGAETLTFERAKVKETKDGKEEEKEVWKNGAGKEVDAMKIEDMLGRLTGVRAASFETGTHPSLKSPALTATLRFNEGKTETVSFGRSGSDVYASRSDEAGSAKLEGMPFDELLKAIDAVK
jgi:hypothetical protein